MVAPYCGNGYAAATFQHFGFSVRASDLKPDMFHAHIPILKEDATVAVGRGDEKVRHGSVRYIVVIQEELSGEHCGNEDNEELLRELGLDGEHMYECHHNGMGFTSCVFFAKLNQ